MLHADAPDTAPGTRSVQPESVVARLRSHGRAIFFPCVVLVADAAAVGYFAGRMPEAWQNWLVLVGALLIAVLLFLVPVVAWLGRNYTITTRRIVLRGGLLVRTRQELLHSRGYDVTVRTNALQALFGSGDVLINTGLERPVVLRDVPGAKLVQSTLHDLMEHSVTSMGSRRQQEQSRPHDETTYLGGR
ncbi:PH domain-containing protein [Salinibacterium sp. ZJ70]|uniref:PH domain-containing protein n=1 Tax=Salinibacterium sp. ZJ70 TaxID=2708084 RepID=UPI001423A50C|nr:PH domain-containing protein [Salinibacterium sp. ZJ70]